MRKSVLDDSFRFVKENDTCTVMSYKGNVFGVEAPNFVDLVVTKTDPGFAGNTATNALKPATLETGAEVKVPLFYQRRRQDQHRHPHRRISGPLQGLTYNKENHYDTF